MLTTSTVAGPHRNAVRCTVLTLLLAAGIFATMAVAGSAAAPRAEEGRLTPVVQSVLSAPRWFKGDDGSFHMEYELMLTNTVRLPVDVTALQIRARRTGHRELVGSATRGGDDPAGERGADRGAPRFDERHRVGGPDFATRRGIPKRIKHRLTIDIGPGAPGGADHHGHRRARGCRAPGSGGDYAAPARWAMGDRRGPPPTRAPGGQRTPAQRPAVRDRLLRELDEQDRTHVGSASENSSYFNYGQPVIAVGAGKVVEAVDRYPDQIPNDKVPVPLEEADGNHVILKLGKRVFAGYAHLKPGSVRVHRGERVRAGRVLGKLGNSGNTTGPHLHFQLMNRPSLLDADGLPFVLDRFKLDGRVPSLEALVDSDLAGTPVPIDQLRRRELPPPGLTNLDVVTFPGG